MKMKKCHCSRRYICVIAVILLISIAYFWSQQDKQPRLDMTRRVKENILIENLKLDKGMGCNIPQMDPFAKEFMKYYTEPQKIKCKGHDWVKCHLSNCGVVPDILNNYTDLVCYYRDLIHESDTYYYFASLTEVTGADSYVLTSSDHASVKCSGYKRNDKTKDSWEGLIVGFRNRIFAKRRKSRKNRVNVLIFGFDSTSRNNFIRYMPKSLEYMTKIMNMTVLKGYNVVGDGTPAALFPILTGKTELELPDVRKSTHNKMDETLFIFHRMKQHGYHTAYFEDMPWVGTFQYRFNGFRNAPADHYIRSFLMEEARISNTPKALKFGNNKYCVGDTPRFKLMMNVTDQFFQLPGYKYGFTFIADITHDVNLIANADADLVKLLEKFVKDGRMDDTLLIVMGDHGARFSKSRQTIQGKLEERLPMMALSLPQKLVKKRPDTLKHLQENSKVLTTPHDIFATVLDAVDMRKHWNNHKVEGADFTRGMTLLEPIPANRSCSEAGIEPHWCSCLVWDPVPPSDELYNKAANALVDFINSLTSTFRMQCAERKLITIHWVTMNRPHSKVIYFLGARDNDGYFPKYKKQYTPDAVTYQVKISVSPGVGVYEASLRYITSTKEFIINSRDISRTNAYNTEPECISDTFPFLNMYCYCKK